MTHRTLEKKLSELTYEIQHNPNCRSPFLLRLPGPKGILDHLPYRGSDNLTQDILGFGKTLAEALEKALETREKIKEESKKRRGIPTLKK